MTDEARLEDTGAGLEPVTAGWFVLNVRDAAWIANETFGAACPLESERAPFPQIGFTLVVIGPGQPSGMYHRESDQEDFLVLAGECLLLIDGEERRLEAGDFVHCPPGTDHVFVGAGAGPCVIFMTGARTSDKSIVYPRSDLALRHGAGVERETTKPSEAYATSGQWRPARPPAGQRLPWT